MIENIVLLEADGLEELNNEQKQPLYFFTVKAKKQVRIMTNALPHLKPFLDEFRRIAKMQGGGEKAKALKEAQEELIIAQAVLLNNKDDAIAQEKAIKAKVKASSAFDEAKEEETEIGLELLESIVQNALSTHYDNALSVLALFDNKKTGELEEEKDIFELADLLFEILESPQVAGFLQRLQRFRSKTQ